MTVIAPMENISSDTIEVHIYKVPFGRRHKKELLERVTIKKIPKSRTDLQGNPSDAYAIIHNDKTIRMYYHEPHDGMTGILVLVFQAFKRLAGKKGMKNE